MWFTLIFTEITKKQCDKVVKAKFDQYFAITWKRCERDKMYMLVLFSYRKWHCAAISARAEQQ